MCLFSGTSEERSPLPHRDGDLHHGRVGGLGPGVSYGYRVHGRWDPGEGIFTNPAKLLLDPYARAVAGNLVANPSLVIHRPRAEDRPDERDNSGFVPRSVIVDSRFDWGSDRRPGTPWDRTVIYETHVRGLTMRHPAVAPELRGTYSGLVSDPVLEHLLALGVTAIELLPVQASFTEPWLRRRDLTNYWGYVPGAFFAPDPRYAATADPVNEFKRMVRALHRHGLEVILDVVYNHTCEGNHQGAVVSFRGLDNPGFYRLDPLDRRRYVDWTGTGNTVDLTSPWALQVVMDSLRYWAEEMHVDGFRFDLAATLGRAPVDFQQRAPFFLAVHQDPVLRSLKLIAEPWDLGPGGYQVGAFPSGWAEWNGRYRDEIRDFWRGEAGGDKLATRLTGSADLYGRKGPLRSVNFITSHDGFTLSDLVSYNNKHNHANREHNHDGDSHNRSWNSGVEGPSQDPDVISLRRRRARSLLATLFLSQGVPMLLGGDELGRTQAGNNNAYCQDNEVSWYDWEAMDWDLIAFVQRLVGLREAHPVLRRPRYPRSAPGSDGWREVAWYSEAGAELTEADWPAGHARGIGALLDGDDRASVFLVFNPSARGLDFTLPPGAWSLELATGEAHLAAGQLRLEDFSFAVLSRVAM